MLFIFNSIEQFRGGRKSDI